jgi:hypothetical protein
MFSLVAPAKKSLPAKVGKSIKKAIKKPTKKKK